MQYSPKLKKAAAEIKTILEKYDIAGVVVLHNAESYSDGHTQGFAEYLYHISPSYSAAKIDGDSLRITTKNLYTKEQKEEKTSKTYNMLTTIGDMLHMLLKNTFVAKNMLEGEIKVIKDNPGRHTSNIQQNN